MSDYNPSDPDEIRATIERTRGELSGNVDALADKVTPSKIVDREKDKLRGRVDSVKDRIFGAASDAKDSISGSASDVGDQLASGPSRAAAKAQGNPIAVGLIAFGVGLLAASLVPASEKEKELASQAKDAVQPALEDVAKEVADNLKEPTQEAAQAVKETAQDATDSVKAAATDEASEVRDTVSQAKDAVQGQATTP